MILQQRPNTSYLKYKRFLSNVRRRKTKVINKINKQETLQIFHFLAKALVTVERKLREMEELGSWEST